MKCFMGQRVVKPECHLDVPTIDNLMRSLANPSRRCSECNELVNIRAVPINNAGPGPQFDKALVVGCEKMIDGVIERVIEEGRSQGMGFADCFEDKKSHKSAGVSH